MTREEKPCTKKTQLPVASRNRTHLCASPSRGKGESVYVFRDFVDFVSRNRYTSRVRDALNVARESTKKKCEKIPKDRDLYANYSPKLQHVETPDTLRART